MSDDPFRDIPLFREIQKLLSSNQGPLNYEIARQIGRSVAGPVLGPPHASDAAQYRDATRNAEDLVSGFTQLRAEPLRFRLVERAEWVDLTLGDWKWLLDKIAGRFSSFGNPEEPEGPDPLQAAMQQVSPLLLGIQTGTLAGNMARFVLGHSDAPIPRESPELLFVRPNVNELMRIYELDAKFVEWLAAREVAHHLVVTSVSWVQPYWRSLLGEIVDALEIDAADLERRFMELQSQGLTNLEEGLSADALLPVVPTPRHSAALSRLRSLTAVVGGYAAYTLERVGATVMGDDASRFGEAVARYEAEHDDTVSVLRDVLGILPDRALAQTGRTFCAAVVKLHGLPVLNRVWDAPDNVPTLAEIRDPFQWLERVVEPPPGG